MIFVPVPLEQNRWRVVLLTSYTEATMNSTIKKYLFVAAAVSALAAPAMADEVGVRVGPVGAGVTVGESHDRDRDRDRDRTTVIKEREPADRTTIIKKDHDDGVETKTIIRRDNN
jgi:hypothetical protein